MTVKLPCISIFLNLPVMLLEINWKMGLQSFQLIMTPLYTEFSLMLKTFTHTGCFPHLWCDILGVSMAVRESELRGDDLVSALPFVFSENRTSKHGHLMLPKLISLLLLHLLLHSVLIMGQSA